MTANCREILRPNSLGLNKPFQKRNGSRATAFAEEHPFLRPLPTHPYELATWIVASVGPNYHIFRHRHVYAQHLNCLSLFSFSLQHLHPLYSG